MLSENPIWLVVDLPLWKIWKSMGRIIPYIMEKNVWNHQPAIYMPLIFHQSCIDIPIIFQQLILYEYAISIPLILLPSGNLT